MRKKAVISIGCGDSQLLIIKAASKLGFAVIGIDRDKNSIGSMFCDEFCVRSTHELSGWESIFKIYSNKYDIVGILNRSSGIPVITAAEISRNLNLSTYSVETAEIVINKHRFFHFLEANNFRIPKTFVYPINSSDLVNFDYPCIVKPSLSSVGKSGIFKVSDSTKLNEFIEKSCESSENGHILIQKFLKGKDVVIISMVVKGRLNVYEVIEEINIEVSGELNGKGVLTPARINMEQRNYLINLAQDLAEKLNIQNSPFMLSFRLDGDIPYVMELHLDFGGDLILDVLLPTATNRNVSEDLINSLLMDKKFPEIHSNAVFVKYNEGIGLNNTRGYRVAKSLKEINKLINEN